MAENGGFLRTKDLSIAFGGLMAVRGVDLQIYRGEIQLDRTQWRRENNFSESSNRFPQPPQRFHQL